MGGTEEVTAGNTVGVCTVQVVGDLGGDGHVACEGRTVSSLAFTANVL